MTVLFESSAAVDKMMRENFTTEETTAIRNDILGIATGELGVSKASLVGSGLSSFFGFKGPDPEEIVKQAIINDAKKMAGDKSYQVDIGV